MTSPLASSMAGAARRCAGACAGHRDPRRGKAAIGVGKGRTAIVKSVIVSQRDAADSQVGEDPRGPRWGAKPNR